MPKKQRYCDKCQHLSPTEEEQAKVVFGKKHTCTKTGTDVRHGSQHPRLPRPSCCPRLVRLLMWWKGWGL
ncbi:MAG: hypothetical protein KAS32_24860 [Candidatus Peribacteraceae bacterium]|nr:hypothetical protein [Candidatus Peribacteraceae bacterium]